MDKLNRKQRLVIKSALALFVGVNTWLAPYGVAFSFTVVHNREGTTVQVVVSNHLRK